MVFTPGRSSVKAIGMLNPRRLQLPRSFNGSFTVCNVLPFTLLFWGQIHISIGLASILNATSPLFGVLIAHLMTQDDKLSAGRVAGLVAGFIGVVMLVGPDLLTDFGTNVLAELACLAAACSYAVGAVMSPSIPSCCATESTSMICRK